MAITVDRPENEEETFEDVETEADTQVQNTNNDTEPVV